MTRSIAVMALTFGIAAAGAALSGCGGPGPFVREGNANSVEIGFSGDVANALPVARRHCAQFERVPRWSYPTLDGAVFDCVPPGAGS